MFDLALFNFFIQGFIDKCYFSFSPPSHIFLQEYTTFVRKKSNLCAPDITQTQPTHWICPPRVHLYSSRSATLLSCERATMPGAAFRIPRAKSGVMRNTPRITGCNTPSSVSCAGLILCFVSFEVVSFGNYFRFQWRVAPFTHTNESKQSKPFTRMQVLRKAVIPLAIPEITSLYTTGGYLTKILPS